MVHRKKIPGLFGANNKGPIILIFSPNSKTLEILTLGLVQCNYRVLQANTIFLAGIKASQMLPSLVIADLSCDNPKDILLIGRLKKSVRTANIPILIISQIPVDPFVKKIIMETAEYNIPEIKKNNIEIIQYPFTFAELVEKVGTIIKAEECGGGKEIETKDTNNIVGERLFDPETEPEKKLHSIETTLNKNWAFPFTVVKALDILESDSSCCTELAKCISSDPAASSAVLKISNTVAFARRYGRVNEVREAIVRLGFRETRNILACLSLIDLSPEVYRNRGFGRLEFWLHSLAVALIAEKLCTHAKFPRPELAFVAGLIHDLGKIPLDNNFETVFPKLLDETINSFCAFYVAEEKLMGFTHATLGHYLTTKWNFHSVISMAILNHHDPEKIITTTPVFDKIVQEAVFVANQLAKATSLGHSCDEILEEIPAEIMKDLHMPKGPDEQFFADVLNEIRQFCNYLNLQLHEHRIGCAVNSNDGCDVVLVYDDKAIYHPMIVALRNNGFCVNQVSVFTPVPLKKKIAIISIPKKGLPLDIMFCDDKKNGKEPEVLKIFLVDTDQNRSLSNDGENNIIFMDRHTFDIRLLIHTLDTFFERISIPAISSTDESSSKIEG
ncbi:MAG: HDOD domain-containing protein [Chitinispirillaceae bacterium]|nr:HDOD domain-containing protein [Chitinispirillaceae bacterium]